MEILFSFFLASILLTLSPGPDLLMVIAQSLEKGRMAAFTFVAGLLTGLLGHTLLLILGWAQFIGERPSVITTIKWLGFVYFLFLGIKSIHAYFQPKEQTKIGSNKSLKSNYWQGVLMNIINPKVSLFFWMFFPGFLFDNTMPIAIQYTVLGGIFLLQAGLVFFAVILFATQFSRFFLRYRLEFVSGVLWLILAVYLLVD